MKFEKFKSEWDKTVVQNMTLRVVVVSMSVVIISLSLVVVSLYNKQRVVFVPPKIDREFYIAGDSPSVSYLEMMGEFIANKMLNITSSNVVERFNSILPFLGSVNYAEVKSALAKQADTVTKANISQIFHVTKIEVDEKLSTIGVQGLMRRVVANQVMQETGSILWIKYKFSGGRFQIADITVSTESYKNPYGPGGAAVTPASAAGKQ